jgi:hypothetical protein
MRERNMTSDAQLPETLRAASGQGRSVLVFLRHLGCAFCHQMLKALREARPMLEERGVRIVLIHMGTDRQADLAFRAHGLHDLPRVSDPGRMLYRAMGLRRVRLADVILPRTLRKCLEVSISAWPHLRLPQGDPMQLPGVFLVEGGRVVAGEAFSELTQTPDFPGLVNAARAGRPVPDSAGVAATAPYPVPAG